MKTGNMTLRPYSIVHSVIYDEQQGKAIGVKVLDSETKEEIDFFAPVIFLNASTLGSTFILLNSVSKRFPNGLGNGSGELGHNLMDHQYRAGADGDFDGFEDKYYIGRRPNGFYIPRFRNIGKDKRTDFIRGFGYQGSASRENWMRGVKEMMIGEELKDAVTTPGGWTMGMTGFGECLPYHENQVSLSHDKKDAYGLPTLNVDAEWKENEKAMRKDMKADVRTIKKGKRLGDRTYKVHLDGYNQMDMITGKGPSNRQEIWYFGESELGAVRIGDYKYRFIDQPGGWLGDKTKPDVPYLINLRLDPFERTGWPDSGTKTGSQNFFQWFQYEFWRFVFVQQQVEKLIMTAVEFPPMQKGASFNLDAVKAKIEAARAAMGK